MVNYRSFFCVALVASTVAFQSPVDAEMYRWVDADGHVFYSDKVPANKSRLERKVLNQEGRVVNTVQAAKTKEQLALEKRLRLLRKEQEKIIGRQKSNDKVLLSTFRNIDDLRMTLNGKLQSVDAQKRVHERTLENLTENLTGERKKAVNAERNGKKVPKIVLTQIASIEEKIKSIYLEIDKTVVKRKTLQIKYDKDIERFLFLTKSNSMSAQALSDETAETKAANTLGLFNCKNRISCDLAWEAARKFVRENSTTPINFNTDSLMMGSDPVLISDISLSVSKLKRADNKVSIFLDIRCHKSSLGQELCQSKKVKNIRHLFRPYIESALKY
ncbi:MAG: DUF4124 domain-containing protein [Methyloprofundus sp.]|nr:DUF4124 domain-containing protein [Methyloprofundus sp.]